MRIWHSIFAVFMVALVMTLGREASGRVTIIVFIIGAAECVCATSAVMLLFRTLGSIGHAKGWLEHIQALLATGAVVVISATLMIAMLGLGATILTRIV